MSDTAADFTFIYFFLGEKLYFYIYIYIYNTITFEFILMIGDEILGKCLVYNFLHDLLVWTVINGSVKLMGLRLHYS